MLLFSSPAKGFRNRRTERRRKAEEEGELPRFGGENIKAKVRITFRVMMRKPNFTTEEKERKKETFPLLCRFRGVGEQTNE